MPNDARVQPPGVFGAGKRSIGGVDDILAVAPDVRVARSSLGDNPPGAKLCSLRGLGKSGPNWATNNSDWGAFLLRDTHGPGGSVELANLLASAAAIDEDVTSDVEEAKVVPCKVVVDNDLVMTIEWR